MSENHMELNEKRREGRTIYEMPDSAYVELKVPREPKTYKMYDLKVNDCSRYGLGMLITQEDFNLLQTLNRVSAFAYKHTGFLLSRLCHNWQN